MEACILICRNQKAEVRKGQVLFIDAVKEVARERSMSFLKPEHQRHIVDLYQNFADEAGFSRAVSLDEIAEQDYSLSIPLYVKRNLGEKNLMLREEGGEYKANTLRTLWDEWERDGQTFWQEMGELEEMLDSMIVAKFDKAWKELSKLNADISEEELMSDIAEARKNR